MTRKTLTKDERFFYQSAGWSYRPESEASEDGRRRCARALASAERKGRAAGLSFEWRQDDIDCTDWMSAKELGELAPWLTWLCIAHDADGKAVASLGAIDFGPDGAPWGDDYRRVVEAELASEALTEE